MKPERFPNGHSTSDSSDLESLAVPRGPGDARPQTRQNHERRTSGLNDLESLPLSNRVSSDDRKQLEAAQLKNEQPEQGREYVFVCGGGHSGTTLMLAILDTHRSITAVPVETGIFHRIENDAEVLNALGTWRDKYKLDPSARYIAEKTPVHCRYIPRIFSLLPQARIILMIRDGRDAALSGSKRLGDFITAVKSWQSSNKSSLPFHQDSRVHIVKYERLVTETESSLREICEFLQIDFDPALLNHHVVERRWWDKDVRKADETLPLVGSNHKINRNWQINQPIFDASGRWQSQMTTEQKATFKRIAGKLLVSLGYADDDNW
jgi:hypothetical protein